MVYISRSLCVRDLRVRLNCPRGPPRNPTRRSTSTACCRPWKHATPIARWTLRPARKASGSPSACGCSCTGLRRRARRDLGRLRGEGLALLGSHDRHARLKRIEARGLRDIRRLMRKLGVDLLALLDGKLAFAMSVLTRSVAFSPVIAIAPTPARKMSLKPSPIVAMSASPPSSRAFAHSASPYVPIMQHARPRRRPQARS